MRLFVRPAALLLATTALAGSGGAARAASDAPVLLDTVTVSAARTEEASVDALSSQSVVSAETVRQSGADRISDLLRAVPGIAVQEAADSPAAAINIRGLQDFGRVAVTIDGARQNFQASGHGLSGGSFLFEPEFLDTATVVRGPVANLYGSGAIGGVVSFKTKSPSTFLRDNETWAVENFTQVSTNNGIAQGLTGAARIDDSFAALGSVVFRNSWAYQDGDGNRIRNSANELLSGLVKAQVTPTEGQVLTLGAMVNSGEYRSGGATSTNYDNSVVASTVSLDYAFEALDHDWIDLDVGAYWTATDLDQTHVTGALTGNTRNFRIDTVGFDVNNTARFDTGALHHALTIGGDLFRDTVDVVDPAGTAGLYTPSGNRTVYGAFLQNTVGYSDWLEVIGALRFDGYRLSGQGTSSSGQRISPKVTVGLSPLERTALHGIQVYGTYAEGYRAPAITETLIAGTHPFPAFDFLPNPDLKPETAHTLEAGINVKRNDLFTAGDTLRLKAAVYRNDVDDFIDITGVGPFNPACFGPCAYQYRNVARARIEGVELEASYDAGWIFAGLSGQHQRGEDRTTGAPLDSIPANKLVTTLGVRAFEEKATLGVQWEAVDAQTRVNTAAPSKAYNLVNLFASYAPREDLRLGVNVDNLFDTQYRPFLDSDASPGLAVKFTLRARLGG